MTTSVRDMMQPTQDSELTIWIVINIKPTISTHGIINIKGDHFKPDIHISNI